MHALFSDRVSDMPSHSAHSTLPESFLGRQSRNGRHSLEQQFLLGNFQSVAQDGAQGRKPWGTHPRHVCTMPQATHHNLATCFAAPTSSSEYAPTSPILPATQQNIHQTNQTFTLASPFVTSLPIATPTRYPPSIDKLVLPHCRRQLAMLRKAAAIRKRMRS